MESLTEPVANEISPQNNDVLESKGSRLLGRPGLRQFVKFCLVGASSTVVDTSIFIFLSKGLGWWWTVAKITSFAFGVTNGFFWNQKWTFNHLEKTNTRRRYAMFAAVNIIGLALALCIMKTVFVIHYGTLHHPNPSTQAALIAQFIAIPIVVFWNFFANKRWTFKA